MTKTRKMTQSGTVPNQLSSRTTKALKRMDTLIAKYVADGLSPEEAKKRATEEMTDHGRQDWRGG